MTTAEVANWMIWAAFAVEYLVVVSLNDRRLAYTRKAWLDVFIILSSFPLLPGLLEATRLLRLLRLTQAMRIVRLFRLAAVITRGATATRTIFRTRGLGYIVVITLLMAMGVGGAFAIIEGVDLVDGLWWAIVTVTTVGYGDMFPATAAGRLAAAVLMLLDIGFVALITASIAAHFVDEDDGPDLTAELARVHERLDTMEALLTERSKHQERGQGVSSG